MSSIASSSTETSDEASQFLIRSRATATIPGDASYARTVTPRDARCIASSPVPQFNSNTLSPDLNNLSAVCHTTSRCARPTSEFVNMLSYPGANLSKAKPLAPARWAFMLSPPRNSSSTAVLAIRRSVSATQPSLRHPLLLSPFVRVQLRPSEDDRLSHKKSAAFGWSSQVRDQSFLPRAELQRDLSQRARNMAFL